MQPYQQLQQQHEYKQDTTSNNELAEISNLVNAVFGSTSCYPDKGRTQTHTQPHQSSSYFLTFIYQSSPRPPSLR